MSLVCFVYQHSHGQAALTHCRSPCILSNIRRAGGLGATSRTGPGEQPKVLQPGRWLLPACLPSQQAGLSPGSLPGWEDALVSR